MIKAACYFDLLSLYAILSIRMSHIFVSLNNSYIWDKWHDNSSYFIFKMSEFSSTKWENSNLVNCHIVKACSLAILCVLSYSCAHLFHFWFWYGLRTKVFGMCSERGKHYSFISIIIFFILSLILRLIHSFFKKKKTCNLANNYSFHSSLHFLSFFFDHTQKFAPLFSHHEWAGSPIWKMRGDIGDAARKDESK